MTSTKPYFIRALNEWILDNELTPHILVDAEFPGVYVPKEYVQDGKIVFNLSPGVSSKLSISNEVLEFDARFAGRLKHIYTPIQSILAIYAKENGRGMVFEAEPEPEDDQGSNGGDKPTPPDSPPKRGKPQLKVVK